MLLKGKGIIFFLLNFFSKKKNQQNFRFEIKPRCCSDITDLVYYYENY